MGFLARELPVPASVASLNIDWQETACLLCGRRDWVQVVEAPDSIPNGTGLWFAVVQCRQCNLCFTNPRPSPASIGRFYPRSYRPHQARRSRRRRLVHSFANLIPGREDSRMPGPGPGRLLDFGCGGGSFLERVRREGWQPTGLDISEAAARGVTERTKCKVLVGSLPHPELEEASFDVITMRQSLEHVHQPLETLREARRLLAPGGKLLVSVPNISSLPFRWFGHAWVGLDLPRHLTHFSPRTLQRMLLRAGFEVGPVHMLRHRSWLQASADRWCRGMHRRSWHRWLRARAASSAAAWFNFLTYQADCICVTAVRPVAGQ